VTRIGAVSHVVLQMMLQRWKMSPNDVQVMQVGSSPNMLVTLDKNGIEAAVLTIPSMFVAEDRGYRVQIDMADTDIYYLHTMIGATRSYLIHRCVMWKRCLVLSKRTILKRRAPIRNHSSTRAC
jgi:ABC-type nitrate/sulfonate/bicarbonate transport system substrate-binding protein